MERLSEASRHSRLEVIPRRMWRQPKLIHDATNRRGEILMRVQRGLRASRCCLLQ
jgi:hypothetical protein